jgi:hypothetical protein
MRDVEATMPAIAPIEDLRAAQKELRSMFLAVFALPLAPYDLRSVGRMSVEPHGKGSSHSKGVTATGEQWAGSSAGIMG